jgi:hypothetical protein
MTHGVHEVVRGDSSAPVFEAVTKHELGEALLALFKVLAPAEGDFTEAEQHAMDGARVLVWRCGVDLDMGDD